MAEVFVLQHEHEVDGRGEPKLLGVYSSRASAEDAVTRLLEQPGFSQYPEGFSIDAYGLDQDHWREGFSTLVPILVELRDEGVDVWRPVHAERLPDGSYRIVTANPNPEDEHWAFPTGAIVRCQRRTFDGEPRLVAVALAQAEGTTVPGASYLNVDLEIRSSSDLNPLAEAVERQLAVLYVGQPRPHEHLLVLEVPGPSLEPDAAIARLAEVLCALPPGDRKLWEEATDRVFDIGLEKESQGETFNLALRKESVEAVARLQARLAFTLYPFPRPSPPGRWRPDSRS